VGLAIFGGFLGALFNGINVKICHFRREYLTGRKYLKFLEAVSISFLTATLLFWSPTWLPECMNDLQVNTECTCFAEQPLGNKTHSVDYNCYTVDQIEDTSQCVDVEEEVERTSQYECGSNEYNNLATLSFQSEETAIKTFFHNTSTIGPKALMFYCFMLFFLAVITYGIAVPSGLFVPCILIGCSYGRMIGELVRNHIESSVNPGTYALIGAVSMLGGVTRMTISLTVIILETTNDIQYLLPIMITLMIAKWVGDYFNISLYDLHVELKCVPFVEAMPPVALEQLDARHVMMEPVITVNEVQSAYEVYQTLVNCTHNGFPVVTEDKGLFRGIVLRNQIIILMQRKFFVELPELIGDEKENVNDDSSSSKSQSLSNVKPSGGANSIELENIDDIEHKRKMDYLARTSHTEVNISKLPFSWDDFYTSLESETMSISELCYSSNDIQALKGKYIDFRAVMNPSPFCVQVDTPLTRVFRLYRSMGIRHLPVVDIDNRCVGMLTRKELRTDFKVDLF